MYQSLLAPAPFNFSSLFFPHAAQGAYYRPLIGLSYLFDKHVWLLNTHLMHLDNIFFHLINALLVYYLATILVKNETAQDSPLPLVAALCFALHPIVGESVNWISGRTDIFACTFVLLGTIAVVRYRSSHRPILLAIALLLVIPGFLAKETPVVFPLSLMLLVFARDANPDDTTPTSCSEIILFVTLSSIAVVAMMVTYSVWPVLIIGGVYLVVAPLLLDRKAFAVLSRRRALIYLLAPAFVIGFFFFFRSLVFTSNLHSINGTVTLIFQDLNYALQTFLGASAFYLKKFFLPLPLNLAIREIDPLYNLLGVFTFMFCLYLLRRNTVPSALFLSGVMFFLPALPLSLGTVTWTAYAERYIYISTAFWTLAVLIWLAPYLRTQRRVQIFKYAALALLGVMAVISFNRSLVWKTNLTLWKDTVAKSPSFKAIRADYMLALINHGQLDEAARQYTIAQAIPTVGYSDRLDLAMAQIYLRRNNLECASALYDEIIKKSHGTSADAYTMYLELLRALAADAISRHEAATVYHSTEKELICLKGLYALDHNPMRLYYAGQLQLALGKKAEAARDFGTAAEKLPPGDPYASFARKLAQRL